MVGNKSFAHRLDDRYATGHSRFVEDGHALFRGELENLRTMLGEERLVSRNDNLAALDRTEDELEWLLDAAHQLDDHLDGRIIKQAAPICGEQVGRQFDRALFGRILDRNPADNEVASDPLTKEGPVFFQIEENPGSDRAKSGQTYTYIAHNVDRTSCLQRGTAAMLW